MTNLAKGRVKFSYPTTKVAPVTDYYNGIKIIDDYRWLEAKNAEVNKWVAKQNKFANDQIKKIKGRKKIRKDLAGIAKMHSMSIYTSRQGRYFYASRKPGQNQSVLYYKDGLNGKENILLDPNKMASDGTKSIFTYVISQDGKLVAFKITDDGNDKSPIQVMEVDSKLILKDYIAPMRSWVVWGKDNTEFYYSRYIEKGDDKKDYRVFSHKLGTSQSSDMGIFGNGLPMENLCSVYTSRDKKYLFIAVSIGSSKNDVYYKNLETDSDVKPLIVGKDFVFSLNSIGDQVFMTTNYKADRFRGVTFDINHPEEQNWKEIIPESKFTLDYIYPLKNYLIVGYIANACSLVKIADSSGKIIKNLDFPAFGYVDGVSNEFNEEEIFFGFTSFQTPRVLYISKAPDFKLHKIYETKVGVRTDNIISKQVWYRSKDGTKISMFVVHKKGIKLNSNNPTLLYGYGGFSSNMSPYFGYSNACFIQDGGIYAMPNLRGGAEYGEEWHKAAMLERKQNSFNDFISAAEWLIRNKYTNEEKLGIWGGSNGGLLVGACMVQRPDLYKAVVCSAGLLDMLRFDKFGIGKYWIHEYGSPEKKKDFKYIRKYSPYHNVKNNAAYPAVLFTTANADNRVDPMHSRKMVALMQRANQQNTVLLRTEFKAGHGFGRSIKQSIEELADIFTFVYYELGMVK